MVTVYGLTIGNLHTPEESHRTAVILLYVP